MGEAKGMTRAERAKLLESLARGCPYWAYVGAGDPSQLTTQPTAIVVREADGALPPEIMAGLVNLVLAGDVVVVMSDQRETRTRVKAEIIAAANAVALAGRPVAGSA